MAQNVLITACFHCYVVASGECTRKILRRIVEMSFIINECDTRPKVTV